MWLYPPLMPAQATRAVTLHPNSGSYIASWTVEARTSFMKDQFHHKGGVLHCFRSISTSNTSSTVSSNHSSVFVCHSSKHFLQYWTFFRFFLVWYTRQLRSFRFAGQCRGGFTSSWVISDSKLLGRPLGTPRISVFSSWNRTTGFLTSCSLNFRWVLFIYPEGTR
jgi:hypothetical protein